MFFKISSSVGSGKTQAVLEHIRDNLGSGYLYVCPTVALCDEVYLRVLGVLKDHPEYINNGPIRRIVTEPNAEEDVFPRAVEACREYDPALPPIVIVTTTTFEYLLGHLTGFDKGRFNVFVDEGLPAIVQEQFSPADPDIFARHFVIDGNGFASPAPGQREILEWVAYSPRRLAGRQLDHLNVEQFRRISKMLVSGNHDVYLTRTDKSLEVLGLLSPEPLRAFRSVTLIVAIFERTLLPIIWRQRHGIEFEDFPLEGELFDAHIEKGPKLSIWHALHEGDLPSTRNLKRNFETGEAGEIEPLKQVIFRAAQQIEAHFEPEPVYCWAANKSFRNPGNVLTGRRMPVISAGLDHYKLFNSVVSLVCINPQPWVKTRMLELFDLENDELYELWRFSHTYQTIGRCSLRMRERQDPVEAIVTSRTCAEQLAAIFPGSRIRGQITDLPRYSTERARDAVVEQFGRAYTPADNSAFSKYRARCKNQGVEPLPKEKWFADLRLPRLQP